jgi:TPR repeat protein
VPANNRSGISLLKSAACEGNTDAMYELGRCFDEGRGVELDLIASIRWYEAAARFHYNGINNSEAQHLSPVISRSHTRLRKPEFVPFQIHQFRRLGLMEGSNL